MTRHRNKPRIALFGSEGGFSLPLLTALHACGLTPSLLITPAGSAHSFPVAVTQTQAGPLQSRAVELDIPVIPITELRQVIRRRALPASRHPELGLVGCFPQRLPAEIIQWPRLGCWNLHPSLLPAYRGPAPLFWQLRDGVPPGITLHQLSDRLDAGPIIAQGPLNLPDGISLHVADQHVAQAGAALVGQHVGDLLAGRLVTRKQNSSQASYQPFPAREDYRLETRWPVRRAFNFMRLTQQPGIGYPVTVDGSEIILRTAVGMETSDCNNSDNRASRPDLVMLRFSDGVLYASVAGDEQPQQDTLADGEKDIPQAE